MKYSDLVGDRVRPEVFATKDPARRSRNQSRKARFTAEAQSTQSFIFKLPPPRPPRLSGEISESFFTTETQSTQRVYSR
jgi:hypothetical protein